MKAEKSVSMHSHAFKRPCKRHIVTDTKSRNASHIPSIECTFLFIGSYTKNDSINDSEKIIYLYNINT